MKEAGGFTLVELLVVIAILGVTIGVTSGILLSLMKSYSKTQVLGEIEQQANFATMKMEKELRDGYWVFKADGSELLFYTKDGAYIYYFVTDGILGRQVFTVDDVGQPQIIDNSQVTDDASYNNGIGGVFVECIGSGGSCFSLESAVTPQIVSISMRFRQAQQFPLNVFAGDVKVLDSIVLRSTY